MYLFYFSRSCGIVDEEENSFIVTGGVDGGTNNGGGDITNRVVKYDKTGMFTDLPNLKTARNLHGCGTYTNIRNQKVLTIQIILFFKTL